MAGKGPIKKFKCERIELCVWESERGNSITIHRNWFDKETKKWNSAKGFYLTDLPKVKAVVEEAIKDLGDGSQVERPAPASSEPDDVPF